jgi:hypothetical protein
MLLQNFQNTAFFEARLVVSASFDRPEYVNDHAIRRDDDMILQAVHPFPSVIHESLIMYRATDFLQRTIHQTGNIIMGGPLCRHAVGKLLEGVRSEASWIEAEYMLPAVINILGNKSGDPRKTCSFPAELHLDIAEPGRIC